jgi:hypothetical protein
MNTRKIVFPTKTVTLTGTLEDVNNMAVKEFKNDAYVLIPMDDAWGVVNDSTQYIRAVPKTSATEVPEKTFSTSLPFLLKGLRGPWQKVQHFLLDPNFRSKITLALRSFSNTFEDDEDHRQQFDQLLTSLYNINRHVSDVYSCSHTPFSNDLGQWSVDTISLGESMDKVSSSQQTLLDSLSNVLLSSLTSDLV